MTDANGNGRLRMQFNSSISLGNLISIVLIIGGVFLAYSEITTANAVQDEKIRNLEISYSEIKQSLQRIEESLRRPFERPIRP